MRLFRKNKTVRAPEITAVSVTSGELPRSRPASPPLMSQALPTPPALQLDLSLPMLSQGSMEFGSSLLPRGGQSSAEQSAEPKQEPNYEVHSVPQLSQSAVDKPLLSLHSTVDSATVPSIGKPSLLSGSYDFDLGMLQLIDSSAVAATPQAPEDVIQHQLLEQFGLGKNTQASSASAASKIHQQNGTANASFSAAQAVQIAQKAHQAHQLSRMNASPAVCVTVSQSSKDDSSGSSDEDTKMPALKSTLAASEGGKKLSDRATYIQKAREASAMGKSLAYNHLVGVPRPADAEDDDESDSIPLGGLRQNIMGASSASMIVESTGKGTLPSQQKVTGTISSAMPNSPMTHGMSPQLHMAQFLQAQQHQQQRQHLAMNTANYSTLSLPQRFQSTGSPANMKAHSLVGSPMQQQYQFSQMPCSPRSPIHTQMQFGMPAHGPRNVTGESSVASAGSASITYGNVGLSRGGTTLPDHAKHAYTPSPLGQPPVTACNSIGIQAMPMDTRLSQFQPTMVGQMPVAPINGLATATHSAAYLPGLMPVQQQQQQQQQQQALIQFMPSQMACRGSLASNPLMRDLNKIKEFSARDYSARPTLLAEADSRKLAKKNMPGLGGTTCHSFQPVAAPPSPPLQSQHGQRASRRGGRDHSDHQDYSREGHRSDMAYRRQSPHHNHDDVASLSSGRSSVRHNSDTRGGRGQRTQRQHRSRHPDHGRYDRSGSAYTSDYEDHHSGREFRRVNSPSRSRRSSNRDNHRSRRGHTNGNHYDYYDYDEFSDEYYSDEYDDLNRREAGGRHGSPSNSTKGLRRRAAQRRTYGDSHTGKESELSRRERSSRQTPRDDRKGSGHRDARRRPTAPAYLDDPRNNSDILPPSDRRAARDSISDDSDCADIPRNSKPRSQFGRFLENIKRNAVVSEASATAPPGQDHSEVLADDGMDQVDSQEGGVSKPQDNRHAGGGVDTENDAAESDGFPATEATATPVTAAVTAS